MLKRIRLMTECALSVPKSLYFCLRVFPLSQAVKLPVLVHYRTRLENVYRGAVKIKSSVSPAMIRMGFGGTISTLENSRNILSLEKAKGESVMVFEGKALFGKGFCIRNHGMLTFGRNFYANKNFKCSCAEQITFGKDVLCGWNVVVRDADGHTVFENDQAKAVKGKVRVGDHVWLCAESHVLKNSAIADDSVLGYKSLLTREFDEPYCLLVGHPAKQVKQGIRWEN